jgi:hypothetical protein
LISTVFARFETTEGVTRDGRGDVDQVGVIVEREENSKGVGGDIIRAADELQRGAERG